MGELINIPASEDNQIKAILDVLATNGGDDVGQIFEALLGQDDDRFEVLAKPITESYLQSLSDSNAKLLIAQSMNALGTKLEDVKEMFDMLCENLDTIDTISKVKKDFLKQLIAGLYNAVASVEGIAKRIIEIPVELCDERAKLPTYTHTTDSGMDVYALEEMVIRPGQRILARTGIKMAIPNGFEVQVRPRSGLSYKSTLRVANTPGTIDSGYRDEICVILENIAPNICDLTIDEDGRVTSLEYGKDCVIGAGERFAQLVLMEVPKAALFTVSALPTEGDRGGGFGSTGNA